MARITDDLGESVAIGAVRRVVSLVPSLTESIAASAAGDRLVGATDWCTHPAGLQVARVRGTKNPDLRAIAALQPDLVIVNKEENRELDVRRLRAAGTAVWVTDIRDVDSAFASLERLFTVALDVAAPDWLGAARQVWTDPPAAGPSVVVPIWRDPWLVVGRDTFTGDVLARLGLPNLFGDHADRYPSVDRDEILIREPDVIVLPDEPYAFGPDDGPECFPGRRCALVEGRLLTWYGPSMVTARATLLDAITSRL
jgi:ABC-type Fe3+-hydroxamate transport system substrate-binding protein